jgi:hypothetical protein
MVRARVRSHLDALQSRLPDLLGACEIKEFAGTDYAYRVFVDKRVWREVVAALADDNRVRQTSSQKWPTISDAPEHPTPTRCTMSGK